VDGLDGWDEFVDKVVVCLFVWWVGTMYEVPTVDDDGGRYNKAEICDRTRSHGLVCSLSSQWL